MLTEFGRLLHQLRLEHGEKTLKRQANLLGVTTARLSHIIRNPAPIDESWPGIIMEAYHLTAQDYERRIAALGEAPPSQDEALMPSDNLSHTGVLLRRLCEESGLTLKDISDRSGLPQQYINFLCISEKTPPSYVADSLAGMDGISPALAAALRRLPGGMDERAIPLRGRTVAQRTLFWHLSKNIHLLRVDAIAPLQDTVTASLKGMREQVDAITPIAHFLREWMEMESLSISEFAALSQISPGILESVLAGACALSPDEVKAVSSSIELGGAEFAAVSFINEISGDSLAPLPKQTALSVEQESLLQLVTDALPYIDDRVAEAILAAIWKARYYGAVQKAGRRVQRAAWGQRPITPAAELLRTLMARHGDNTAGFSTRTGISPYSFMRFSRGEQDIGYTQFQDIVCGYQLGSGVREVFRYLCGLSQRIIIFDMAACPAGHRIAASALQAVFPLLSPSDLDEILTICNRAGAHLPG